MKNSISSRSINYVAGLLLTLASLGGVSNAHADLVVENEAPPPPPVVVVQRPATIENVGSPSVVLLMRRNVVNVEFTKALKQIVPAGWKGFADASTGVTKIGLISIKAAKRPWIEVLEEVLDQNGIRAVLDWDRKEITFKERT